MYSTGLRAIFFSTRICLDCSTIYGQATGNREPDAVPLRGHVHNAPLLYRLPGREEETRQDGRCGPGGVVHVHLHVLSATLVVVSLVYQMSEEVSK